MSPPTSSVPGLFLPPAPTGGRVSRLATPSSPLLAVTFILLILLGHASANHLALLSGTLRTYQRHACDHSVLNLHCPVHTTIDVLYAHYGRPAVPASQRRYPGTPETQSFMLADEEPPYDPCPPLPGQHKAPLRGQECVLQEANYEILQRVVGDCQHRQQCRLQVAPQTFLKRDPCPTTRKYVEVAYKCRPATFINKVVCEGEEHVLRCEANSRLAVYSVLFGRTVAGVVQCPQPPTAPEEECQASYATEVVMKACQGKRSCHLLSDAARFGGTSCTDLSRLYMKTVYTCVPRSILKTSYQSVLEADEAPQLESSSQQPADTTSIISSSTVKRPQTQNTDNGLPLNDNDLSSSNRRPFDGYDHLPSTDKEAQQLAPTSVFSQLPSLPFFNPTVKPPPHKKVKDIDELSYRQHDQQHVSGSTPDLINCTVTILSGSKEREIGFITEWMRAVGFVTRNLEKFTLYMILGLFCGVVTLLGVVVARLLLDRRRVRRNTKVNSDHLTSVFSPEIEDVDGDLDMTVPIGCSTMASGRGQSPTRASSPLPLPEVVRYNTTPRGIVTIRRHDSDIIVPPRSLSRTNNNQLFYS